MAVLKSFELKGNKQSFANWISNLSVCDTPFTAMIDKESIDQTQYSWQTDTLDPPSANPVLEGSLVDFQPRAATKKVTNFTQILRKVVKLTDTNAATHAWGRKDEMVYQMGKAGKEILRDLEYTNLNQIDGIPAINGHPGHFAGFEGLVAVLDEPCPDTGAIVHKEIVVADGVFTAIDRDDLFDMTYNLYLSGSKADKIMFHPKHAQTFSALVTNNLKEPNTYRLFDGVSDKYNAQVNKIRDPLGREYTLIPNRFMPEEKIYFFSEKDWTQMVLREPRITVLAKNGTSNRKMVEMEVGLRHKHPYASGILSLNPVTITNNLNITRNTMYAATNDALAVSSVVTVDGKAGAGAQVTWYTSDPDIVYFSRSTATAGPTGSASSQLRAGDKAGVARVWTVCRGVKSEEHVIVCLEPTIELLVSANKPDVGETVALTATVKKGSALAGTGLPIRWYVTPPDNLELPSAITNTASGIATIDGVVRNKDATLVQAVLGEFASEPFIINSLPVINDGDFSITPNTFAVGAAVEAIATVTDGYGNVVEGIEVKWKISNPNLAELGSASSVSDSLGNAAVALTGLAKGRGYITPVINDVEFTPVYFFVGTGATMEFLVEPNPGTVGEDLKLTVSVNGKDGSHIEDAEIIFVTSPIEGPEFPGGSTDVNGVYEIIERPVSSFSGVVTAYCPMFDAKVSVDLAISG